MSNYESPHEPPHHHALQSNQHVISPTGDERERAKVVAEQWAPNKEYEVISEGQEKPEFWDLLGGQEEYANDVRLADPLISRPARLFHCSDASGAFRGK